MVTDLSEVFRLGTAKAEENLAFRRHLSAHHVDERAFQILASDIQRQMDLHHLRKLLPPFRGASPESGNRKHRLASWRDSGGGCSDLHRCRSRGALLTNLADVAPGVRVPGRESVHDL